MNNLIIYYSRRGENYVDGGIVSLEKGNTEVIADYIRDAVGADMFEIRTIKTYPEDYMECTRIAQDEQKQHARPELQEYLQDISGYDNIVVASPCWWGDCPCAVLTQLEKLDFKGKKVFPVMTHEGSGLGSFPRTLKRTCKGAKIGKGLAVHGAEAVDSEDAVKAWAVKNLK